MKWKFFREFLTDLWVQWYHKHFTKVISFHFGFHFRFCFCFSFNNQTSYWNSAQVYFGNISILSFTKPDAIFPRRCRKLYFLYLIPLHYKSLLVHGEKKGENFLHFVIIIMEVMEVQTTTTLKLIKFLLILNMENFNGISIDFSLKFKKKFVINKIKMLDLKD